MIYNKRINFRVDDMAASKPKSKPKKKPVKVAFGGKGQKKERKSRG